MALKAISYSVPVSPSTYTTATPTISLTDNSIIFNYAGVVTATLPTASNYYGKYLNCLNYTANAVNSASSNVIAITGGAASTSVLPATAGSWCLLQSNGTNWVTMQRGT